jgi:C4-type Zn-finger protein
MAVPNNERQEKIERILQRMQEQLEQEWPEGEADVTRVEEIVRRVERDVLRELTEELLREQSGKRPGNQVACPCGAQARYRKQSAQELVTLFGRVQIERAYFYCSSCGEGLCPQDRA